MLLYFGVTELTLEIYYRQQDKRYLCAVSEKNRDEVKKKKLQCYESQHCLKKNVFLQIYTFTY